MGNSILYFRPFLTICTSPLCFGSHTLLVFKCLCLCVFVRWTRQTVPLVNPTAEPLKLHVANSNPRNFKLEIDSGKTVSTQTHLFIISQ